jgi:GDP-4-dehydro-6-deoxy-D-mannose reductase
VTGVAVVTGGHGFVGTTLRELLAGTGWSVVSVGRAARTAPVGERYVRLDLTDADAVTELLDAVRPDVVFHLAASSPQRTPDPAVLVADAVGATHALCAALRRTAGAAGGGGPVRRAGDRTRLVLAGSSAQYGAVPREENPVTEETRCRPVGAYGFAKVAAESTALALAADGAFELVPVRGFNHLGPGEPATTVAGAFAARVAALRAGRVERIEAMDLDAVRDFTDVRDIARGYLALAERGRPGRVYQLCSGRPTRVGEVLDGLLAVAGLDRSRVDERRGGPGGIPYQVGSPARVAAEAGWRAEIPLDRSLADLFGQYAVEQSQYTVEQQRSGSAA